MSSNTPVQDCLDSEGIQRLVWPARSPDLNPIENVWDALGRQIAGRNYPPTNKNTLIRALTEEWDKLPQQLLDNVVQNGKSLTQRFRGPAFVLRRSLCLSSPVLSTLSRSVTSVASRDRSILFVKPRLYTQGLLKAWDNWARAMELVLGQGLISFSTPS
ncbi:hypothetical protein TNCV_3490061 [Trichonephila clavipes]|nr:hypothetical protein TNCV_3490061 [Trichonephila clavipes]